MSYQNLKAYKDKRKIMTWNLFIVLTAIWKNLPVPGECITQTFCRQCFSFAALWCPLTLSHSSLPAEKVVQPTHLGELSISAHTISKRDPLSLTHRLKTEQKMVQEMMRLNQASVIRMYFRGNEVLKGIKSKMTFWRNCNWNDKLNLIENHEKHIFIDHS